MYSNQKPDYSKMIKNSERQESILKRNGFRGGSVKKGGVSKFPDRFK